VDIEGEERDRNSVLTVDSRLGLMGQFDGTGFAPKTQTEGERRKETAC
jgi:hypothetical protein